MLAINRWQANTPPKADASTTALRAELPTALVTDSAHGPRIVAVNKVAADAGIAPATRLADARGLCPGLNAVAHDSDGDRLWIEQCVLWAQRWGPLTALDGPDALLVDISGAAHLFGGEASVCGHVVTALAQQGFDACTGIAATPGAAWAMSHYARPSARAGGTIIAEDGDPLDWLGPLPVAALRLATDTLLLLRRLGIKRIADLVTIDRNALARRFRNRRTADSNPLIRLDQLLGRTPEPLLPAIHVAMPLVQHRLAEPLLHRSLLDRVITDLAVELANILEAQRLGARRVHLRAWRIDGDRIERQIELASATRDNLHFLRLLAPRLDDIDAGFGIDQVQLLCPWAEPLAMAQAELAPGGAPDQNMSGKSIGGTRINAFVDRVVARLGAQAISRPVAHASHLPERSQRFIPPLAPAQSVQTSLPLYERPLKLLDRAEPISVLYATPEGLPRRFRWRGKVHDIVRVEGPERIAPEWWREKSTARLRDYYRIESGGGARYWIYRHGSLRDGRGGLPDWFLQGLFA